MTASITKITAGSGYEYLTRQVARLDATSEGRPSLASYYTEKGETPGRWVGSGLAGLGGLFAGDEVTAAQMWNLFGVGYHPLAELLQDAAAADPEATPAQIERAGRLGNPFRVYPSDVSPFKVEVARRFHAHNTAQGLPRDAAIEAGVRARIRTEVAREMFLDEYRRPPRDARELAGHVAKLSRQQTTAVAGFDVTFSPVKSVSTLWALAPPQLAASIERCHHQAVADALRMIEASALYTREGDGGVRQVDVQGLIAAAFTHRDSRAGDPDLHTHVAIANKVQTLAGRWLAIDGRVLLKATVTISETYNTALERHLTETLGVRFEDRPTPDGKRPVREIAGIHPALNERWSTRRQHIETRRAELATAFQRDHGRPPSPTEAIALAQQATLETRDAKHAPRSLAEQRTTWHAEALDVLGSSTAITRMIHQAVSRPDAITFTPDPAWIDHTAHRIVTIVEAGRSTWQGWHLRAEALRQLRAAHVAAPLLDQTADLLVATALAVHCTPITPARPSAEPREPAPLRRRDGTSQYTVAGNELYTSARILTAEQAIIDAAARTDGYQVTTAHVAVALAESAANGTTLNPGQAALVEAMATSGRRVQAAIAPAGSGKTTAMRALAQAWTDGGGTLIGLAPSAAAAAQLRDQLDAPTDTLAKLVWYLDHPHQPGAPTLGPTTLVVIDEAGMADTLTLHRVIDHALDQGASLRLIGDDQQLAAIGAGGVLRDLHATHGVLHLDELVRFHDPAEGAASLALRAGRTEALGFYLDRQRLHVGDLATAVEDLFTDWHHDRSQGLDAIMLAPTRDLVADLNTRARTQRLTGSRPDREVTLADGLPASQGDTIITRTNNRRLRTSATDFVKNGDRWTILDVHPDGSLHAQHARTRRTVTLPADYVTASVELGYATTIHTAQGISVDVTRGVLTGVESRQLLYTMLSRGRQANHAYLAVVADGNEHSILAPETLNPLTPTDLLEKALARDLTPQSATTLTRQATDPRRQLADAAARYADAITVAAHDTADPDLARHLTRRLGQAIPGLSDWDAWPTLLNHLLLIDADGRDPFASCAQALDHAPLGNAHDPAAVLLARLDHHPTGGPLPWLPGVPTTLTQHPVWGPYLAARRHLVTTLTEQVRQQVLTTTDPPVWAAESPWPPAAALIGDVEVWRAATGVEPADLRPTGDPAHHAVARRHQERLNRRLREGHNPALTEWVPLLTTLAPTVSGDPHQGQLARRLAHLASQGLPAATLLTHAVAEGPLPDDHPASALWWRITRHLDHPHRTVGRATPAAWLPQLNDLLDERADAYQASPWWPTLLDAVDRGLARGWILDTLLDHPHQSIETLLDHVTRLADLHPSTDEPDPNPAPTDLWDGHPPRHSRGRRGRHR